MRARKPRSLEQSHQSRHGLHAATEQTESRRHFGAEEQEAEARALQSGKTYDALEAFAYIKARARGEKARRPRPKT
jgi:hypothetical protein